MDFLDPAHLWEASTPQTLFILVLLLIMGVASIYVGIERWVTFNKARAQSRDLAATLGECLADGALSRAINACQDPQYKFAYLGHLMEAGLKEVDERFDNFGVHSAERAMERRAVQEAADLKRGMNILATVGSTAPFVGLVGTIFGIINAFGAMAETGSGGLGAVSAGIAEALVATAFGIFVALIGVWLFNYFNGRIEQITNDITVSIQEFIDWCEKRLQAGLEPDATTQAK